MSGPAIYRCVALDDQLFATGIIAAYINKIPDLHLVKATTNVFDVLKIVDEGLVDLVFLDIQMPELNGIQFLKLCGNKCKVILTTAYPEYALQGFDLDVVDYLLKPIAFERFQKAIDKFRLLMMAAAPPSNTPTQRDYVLLKGDAKNKFHQIKFSDILFVKGLNNYISIYTKAQQIIIYMSLKEIIHLLPEDLFCRVHRSYIVSLEHIKLIDRRLLFIGGHSIPISDGYKVDFFSKVK